MTNSPIVGKGTALTIRGHKLTVERIANDGVELRSSLDGNIKLFDFETIERVINGEEV